MKYSLNLIYGHQDFYHSLNCFRCSSSMVWHSSGSHYCHLPCFGYWVPFNHCFMTSAQKLFCYSDLYLLFDCFRSSCSLLDLNLTCFYLSLLRRNLNWLVDSLMTLAMNQLLSNRVYSKMMTFLLSVFDYCWPQNLSKFNHCLIQQVLNHHNFYFHFVNLLPECHSENCSLSNFKWLIRYSWYFGSVQH